MFSNTNYLFFKVIIISCFWLRRLEEIEARSINPISSENEILSKFLTSNQKYRIFKDVLIFLSDHFFRNESKASLTCGTQSNNIYSFTINAESPLGLINLFYVQHDGSRIMPFATTTLQNSLNHNQLVERVDNFRKHSCTAIQDKQTSCSSTYKMTPAQAALTGRTAFDRGHLTPVNPMRFSESAVDHTFYCINIAPQEPYTNQGPWAQVEALVHAKLDDTTPGYVMTGVCDNDSSDGVTLDGWRVPDCFWKLVCYKDSGNVARVVGFIGENQLFHKDNTVKKAERSYETTKPRSQSAILARMNRASLIQDAWRKAQTYLLVNRNENDIPSPTQCINALTAPTATLIEWGLQ